MTTTAPPIQGENAMDGDMIIVTTQDARQLLAGPGNPHLIAHGGEVRVVRGVSWRNFYARDGALLIMTRADLAEIDPDALGYDPAMLACLLLHML